MRKVVHFCLQEDEKTTGYNNAKVSYDININIIIKKFQ